MRRGCPAACLRGKRYNARPSVEFKIRIKYIINGKADQHAGILKNSNRKILYDLSAVAASGRNPGRLCGMFSV